MKSLPSPHYIEVILQGTVEKRISLVSPRFCSSSYNLRKFQLQLRALCYYMKLRRVQHMNGHEIGWKSSACRFRDPRDRGVIDSHSSLRRDGNQMEQRDRGTERKRVSE